MTVDLTGPPMRFWRMASPAIAALRSMIAWRRLRTSSLEATEEG